MRTFQMNILPLFFLLWEECSGTPTTTTASTSTTSISTCTESTLESSRYIIIDSFLYPLDLDCSCWDSIEPCNDTVDISSNPSFNDSMDEIDDIFDFYMEHTANDTESYQQLIQSMPNSSYKTTTLEWIDCLNNQIDYDSNNTEQCLDDIFDAILDMTPLERETSRSQIWQHIHTPLLEESIPTYISPAMLMNDTLSDLDPDLQINCNNNYPDSDDDINYLATNDIVYLEYCSVSYVANNQHNMNNLNATEDSPVIKFFSKVLGAFGLKESWKSMIEILEKDHKKLLKDLGKALKKRDRKKALKKLKKLLGILKSKAFLRKLGKKIGPKVAAKIIGRILSKFIPIVGWAIIIIEILAVVVPQFF